MLDAYFIPKVNVIQREDASIQQYVWALHDASARANFQNREEAERDRTVLGVKDKKPSQKLHNARSDSQDGSRHSPTASTSQNSAGNTVLWQQHWGGHCSILVQGGSGSFQEGDGVHKWVYMAAKQVVHVVAVLVVMAIWVYWLVEQQIFMHQVWLWPTPTRCRASPYNAWKKQNTHPFQAVCSSRKSLNDVTTDNHVQYSVLSWHPLKE